MRCCVQSPTKACLAAVVAHEELPGPQRRRARRVRRPRQDHAHRQLAEVPDRCQHFRRLRPHLVRKSASGPLTPFLSQGQAPFEPAATSRCQDLHASVWGLPARCPHKQRTHGCQGRSNAHENGRASLGCGPLASSFALELMSSEPVWQRSARSTRDPRHQRLQQGQSQTDASCSASGSGVLLFGVMLERPSLRKSGRLTVEHLDRPPSKRPGNEPGDVPKFVRCLSSAGRRQRAAVALLACPLRATRAGAREPFARRWGADGEPLPSGRWGAARNPLERLSCDWD